MKRFIIYIIIGDLWLLMAILHIIKIANRPVRAVDMVLLIGLFALSGVYHFRAIRALRARNAALKANPAAIVGPSSAPSAPN